MMTKPIDDMLRVQQTALGLRAQRQQTLASNIANADTPNFKARDLDFRSAMDAAMGGTGVPAAPVVDMKRTSARHLEGSGNGGALEANMRYRTETQSSADGNTVDIDVERAAFAENAVHYEALITFIGQRLRGLQTAIQGQ